MPKSIFRIVAILLISCLVADPAIALAVYNPPSSFKCEIIRQHQFEEGALLLPLAASAFIGAADLVHHSHLPLHRLVELVQSHVVENVVWAGILPATFRNRRTRAQRQIDRAELKQLLIQQPYKVTQLAEITGRDRKAVSNDLRFAQELKDYLHRIVRERKWRTQEQKTKDRRELKLLLDQQRYKAAELAQMTGQDIETVRSDLRLAPELKGHPNVVVRKHNRRTLEQRANDLEEIKLLLIQRPHEVAELVEITGRGRQSVENDLKQAPELKEYRNRVVKKQYRKRIVRVPAPQSVAPGGYKSAAPYKMEKPRARPEAFARSGLEGFTQTHGFDGNWSGRPRAPFANAPRVSKMKRIKEIAENYRGFGKNLSERQREVLKFVRDKKPTKQIQIAEYFNVNEQSALRYISVILRRFQNYLIAKESVDSNPENFREWSIHILDFERGKVVSELNENGIEKIGELVDRIDRDNLLLYSIGPARRKGIIAGLRKIGITKDPRTREWTLKQPQQPIVMNASNIPDDWWVISSKYNVIWQGPDSPKNSAHKNPSPSEDAFADQQVHALLRELLANDDLKHRINLLVRVFGRLPFLQKLKLIYSLSWVGGWGEVSGLVAYIFTQESEAASVIRTLWLETIESDDSNEGLYALYLNFLRLPVETITQVTLLLKRKDTLLPTNFPDFEIAVAANVPVLKIADAALLELRIRELLKIKDLSPDQRSTLSKLYAILATKCEEVPWRLFHLLSRLANSLYLLERVKYHVVYFRSELDQRLIGNESFDEAINRPENATDAFFATQTLLIGELINASNPPIQQFVLLNGLILLEKTYMELEELREKPVRDSIQDTYEMHLRKRDELKDKWETAILSDGAPPAATPYVSLGKREREIIIDPISPNAKMREVLAAYRLHAISYDEAMKLLRMLGVTDFSLANDYLRRASKGYPTARSPIFTALLAAGLVPGHPGWFWAAGLATLAWYLVPKIANRLANHQETHPAEFSRQFTRGNWHGMGDGAKNIEAPTSLLPPTKLITPRRDFLKIASMAGLGVGFATIVPDAFSKGLTTKDFDAYMEEFFNDIKELPQDLAVDYKKNIRNFLKKVYAKMDAAHDRPLSYDGMLELEKEETQINAPLRARGYHVFSIRNLDRTYMGKIPLPRGALLHLNQNFETRALGNMQAKIYSVQSVTGYIEGTIGTYGLFVEGKHEHVVIMFEDEIKKAADAIKAFRINYANGTLEPDHLAPLIPLDEDDPVADKIVIETFKGVPDDQLENTLREWMVFHELVHAYDPMVKDGQERPPYLAQTFLSKYPYFHLLIIAANIYSSSRRRVITQTTFAGRTIFKDLADLLVETKYITKDEASFIINPPDNAEIGKEEALKFVHLLRAKGITAQDIRKELELDYNKDYKKLPADLPLLAVLPTVIKLFARIRLYMRHIHPIDVNPIQPGVSLTSRAA